LQLGYLVEVKIIGDNLGMDILGQGDQFGVYFLDFGVILIDDLHFQIILLLNSIQNIQAPPSSSALQRIRGVCDVSKFLEDKLGNDKRPFDESRIANIRDASVDDYTGIQHFIPVALLGDSFRKPGKLLRLKLSALFDPLDQTQITDGAIDEDVARKINFQPFKEAGKEGADQ
jgi:hypothetical protein